MFVRYRQNTVIEAYISQAFEIYRPTIVSKHIAQYKEEDIKGESCIQYSIMDIHAAILYVAMIYNDVDTTSNSDWSYYDNKYEVSKMRKCLACKSIDLDDILTIFGLPFDDSFNGIEQDIIEETFEIEPLSLNSSFQNVYNINDYLNNPNGCRTTIYDDERLFLETQEDDVFLEIQDDIDTQQIFLEL